MSSTINGNKKNGLLHFFFVKSESVQIFSFEFQIAPVAFNDSDEYVYRTETVEDVQDIQRFFNDNTSQAQYKGLALLPTNNIDACM